MFVAKHRRTKLLGAFCVGYNLWICGDDAASDSIEILVQLQLCFAELLVPSVKRPSIREKTEKIARSIKHTVPS